MGARRFANVVLVCFVGSGINRSLGKHHDLVNQSSAGLRLREIVRSAAELFDSSGYANASMEDIADAVGLAKPTLYHYVKSKDEILHLIHQEFMDVAFAKLEARLAEGESAQARIRGIVIDIVELVASHRPLVRVFFEHFRDLAPAKRRSIVTQRHRYMKLVERAIRRGISEGEFVPGLDPVVAALAIFGIANWTYQWYNPRGRLSAREIGTAFADLILHGLAPTRVKRSRRPRSVIKRGTRRLATTRHGQSQQLHPD